MYKKHFISFFFVTILTYSFCFGQKQILYKQIDTTKLFIEIYYPKTATTTKEFPAMVFFFGGGWKGGDRYHFVNHALYFQFGFPVTVFEINHYIVPAGIVISTNTKLYVTTSTICSYGEEAC